MDSLFYTNGPVVLLLLLLVFISSRSWRVMQFHGLQYGEKKLIDQSEFMRLATLLLLLLIACEISYLSFSLIDKAIQMTKALLDAGLIIAIFLFTLKLFGKVDFKGFYKSQKYTRVRVVVIFLVFLSAGLLVSTFFAMQKHDISIKDILASHFK